MENLSQDTQIFYNELKQTCMTFVLEGEIKFIILDIKPAFLLLQRESLSLSSEGVQYKNYAEKIGQSDVLQIGYKIK